MLDTTVRARVDLGDVVVRRAFLAILMLLAGGLLQPTSARALVATNFRAVDVKLTATSKLPRCRGWSGDTDDAGRHYVLCLLNRDTNGDGVADGSAPGLVEVAPDGMVSQIGWLPAAYHFAASAPDNYVALDAAVTPDGMTAYVTPGPNIDNLGLHPDRHPFTRQQLPPGVTTGAILRLRRGLDGVWRHDPTFKAGPFLLGTNYWSARRVDVDRSGRLYVSVNAWVYELDPATGAIVSRFGEGTTDGIGGRWLDGLEVAQGIAVSGDGSSMLVVEQRHNLIQRWRRIDATSWQRDTTLLLGTPSVIGDYCGSNAHFQSPYDVATDVAGDIYVLDTTCNRVQRFDRTGRFVQTAWQDRTADTPELSHGIAVSPQGSILLPTSGQLLQRLDPARPPVTGGGGCTDRLAPTITYVGIPRRTTSRSVSVVVDATDDCADAVTWRISGDHGAAPSWSGRQTHVLALTGWNGAKRLLIEARDAAGRRTARAATINLELPQPALRARTGIQLAGSGCSRANPLGRITAASSYRVADRCAVIVGRITRIERRPGSLAVEVQLSTTLARRIYANAVGPIRLWIATDRVTRLVGDPRAGRIIRATGTIIVTRSRSAAYMIPVDHARSS